MAPAGGTVRELRIFSVIFLLASVGWLGGCALLPATGPTGVDVRAGQTDAESLPYALVRVNRKVTAVLAKEAPRLATAFADRRPPKGIRIGIGDIVAVTIFEATSGGLFIPAEAGVRPGNFISLPIQAVDVNGNISVPYAGNIRANGRTPVEIQQAIVDALKDRAIEPQVVVSVVEQRTSLITILGDVGSPRRIPASAEGERLLDAIARGSGTAGPGSDSCGSCWNDRDDGRPLHLARSFTSRSTIYTCTRMIRSMCIGNRRHSWHSERLAINSRYLLGHGDSRLLKRSLGPVA